MRWYEERATLRAEVERLRAAGPSRMEADAWVRIQCDYAVGSVWSRDGTPGQPEQLPISFDLMVRLHRWQDLFEDCDDWDRHGNRWTPEQDRAWSDEGLAIAIEMKRELPRWTILYHDGWRAIADDMPQVGSHRTFFGYEITDEVVRSGRRPVAGGAGLQRPQGRTA